MKILIEVCIASVEDAIVAQRAGADRLELNAALALGGLTPSIGLLREVKASVDLPVVAMLRPREGDFVYAASEHAVMQRDADSLIENGADGIAFGFLTRERGVDVDRTADIVRRIGARQSVFHRAFDFVADPLESVTRLIDLGIDRVMTSGARPTAEEGMPRIRELVERFGTRIEILPAAGIGPENAAKIVAATGCDQLHGSFSSKIEASETGENGPGSLSADGLNGLTRTDDRLLRQVMEGLAAKKG